MALCLWERIRQRDGNGRTDVGGDGETASKSGTSLLRAVEQGAGEEAGLTPLSRSFVRAFMRCGWVARVYGAGRYFRLLLVGYFEGLNSERAIAWRGVGFGERASLSGIRSGGGTAESFDLVADAEVHEVVADKGYHSNETVLELKAVGLRSYLSETDRGRRNWKGNNKKYQAPVYANRRRIRGRRGRRLQRQRSELVERPFAHQFVTGGLRRIFVRGHANVRKRLLIHVCGFNLALLMRHLTGVGTPRSLQSRAWTRLFTVIWAPMGHWIARNHPWGRFWASIRPDSLFCAPGIHH